MISLPSFCVPANEAYFVRDAFHHAAVAEEYIRVMIDDRVARPIECRGERALRKRHADRIRKTLAERSGGGLDAEMHLAFRVPWCLRTELPKILHLLHRQGIAREMQHGIQQHGCVAVRQHESVAIPPARIPRIELKYVAPEHFGDIRHAHWGARVARIGLLDGIHRQGTNGIGKLAAGWHGRLLLWERAGILPDALFSSNDQLGGRPSAANRDPSRGLAGNAFTQLQSSYVLRKKAPS